MFVRDFDSAYIVSELVVYFKYTNNYNNILFFFLVHNTFAMEGTIKPI